MEKVIVFNQEDEQAINDELSKESIAVKQKIKLEVGKRYRGSFWVNEFGEVQVCPEQKGTNPQGIERITGGDFHVIYRSKNFIRVVISLPRGYGKEVINVFKKAVATVIHNFYMYNLIDD